MSVSRGPTAEHVPVAPMSQSTGQIPVDLVFPWGGVDDLRWRLQPALRALDDRAAPLRADHKRFKGAQRKRGKQHAIASLGAFERIVLRRSRVEPVYASLGLPMDDWRPVHLYEDGEPLDPDFVMLDPRQTWIMDRDACDATWSLPESPHAAHLVSTTRLGWSPGRAAAATAIRLVETGSLSLLRRDVAEALVAATRGQLAIVDPPYPLRFSPFAPSPVLGMPTQVPETAYPWTPPAIEAADDARATADAFWRIAAQWSAARPPPGTPAGDPGDRKLACANPHYALALARCLDGEAFDDTAAGVLGSPLRAWQFAIWVDGQCYDETRTVAARLPSLAYAYAKYVDHGAHPTTEQAVAGTEWAPEYAALVAEAPRLWLRILGREHEQPPLPDPATVPVVAAREWPVHDVARYAEASVDASAPRRHEPMEADLRSDIDAFSGNGLEQLGLSASARPDEVVSAMHRFVTEVQARRVKLGPKKKRTVMALGCALGEQVHRALGWQWALVRTPDGGGVAIVPPDGAVAFYPLAFVERQLTPGGKHNAIALQFNMLVAGSLPPGAAAGAYAAVT